MRISVAVLLLCIGIINAQERSISGGISRRNQFSAGKSQAIGFNCPEDFGYYPHPTDCGQYYVCVFGGALLESCTGGLMYSNELQTCDWPRNVICNDANGPGISTVKVTDPRTSVRSGNQVLSATESLTTSSLKRADNAIRSREPVKSSGTSKSVFDDSSRLRQGRFILGQESSNQNFNTGFQAQETSSRAFNVVAASPSPKFVFPKKTRKTRDIHRRHQPSFFDHDGDFHEISFPTSALIAAGPRDSSTTDPRDRSIRQTHDQRFSHRPRDPFFDSPTHYSQDRDLLERRPFLYQSESSPARAPDGFFSLSNEAPFSPTFEGTHVSSYRPQNQNQFHNRPSYNYEPQDFRQPQPHHRNENSANRHFQPPPPQPFRTTGPIATNHFSMGFSRLSEHQPRPFSDDEREKNSQQSRPPISHFGPPSTQHSFPPNHKQHNRVHLQEPPKNMRPPFEQSPPASRPNFVFPPNMFNSNDPDLRSTFNPRPENQLNTHQIEENEEGFEPPYIEGSVPLTNLEEDHLRDENIPASKEISSNNFSSNKFVDENKDEKPKEKPKVKIISTNFATSNNLHTSPTRKPSVRLTTLQKAPTLDQTTRQPARLTIPKFQSGKRNRNRHEESKAPHIPGTARQPELSKLSSKVVKDKADKNEKDRPLLPGAASTNRFAAPTAAPAVAPARATPAVGQSFYNDLLNLNDTDYYYYYDDILYDDYYEPTTKTTPRPRQTSRSRGNSPDLANSVIVAPSVSNKGRGSSSRPSSPSSPISPDSSFNSSPSSSFLGTFSSPPARTAVRTGGETTSFAKQTKKPTSKSSSSTRPSINQHSLSTPNPDSTSIDSSTTQRSSTALNFTVPSFPEQFSHLPSITNTSQLNAHSTPVIIVPPTPEQTQITPNTTLLLSTPNSTLLQSTPNTTLLQSSQKKFPVSAHQNIILEPVTLENSEFKKPSNKLKRKHLEPSLSHPTQSFASPSFDTTGSGPFAPPGASPRIRIVENRNGFQNKPNSKPKLFPDSSDGKNHRLPFNLATITFDLLRDRSRSLKDPENASNVNKAPTLLSLPLRPILNLNPLTDHPLLDNSERFPVRSVTRMTTFLLPKSSNDSTTSSRSSRLKGSVIPSHVRLVTSQPLPLPVLPSQRKIPATHNQNGSKHTRRISAPIPKRINNPITLEPVSLNSSIGQRSFNGPNIQAKRISTSQTLFKQMLNSERDNIISRGKNVRIGETITTLSSTVKPPRTTFTFSTITTTEPTTVFTPSSTPFTPVTSPKEISSLITRNKLRSALATAAETKTAITTTPKSVTTSRPKSKQTFTTAKMSTPSSRISNSRPKPSIIKNHLSKTTLKSNTATFTTSPLKTSTAGPTITVDNLSAPTEAPREAPRVNSSALFSVVNETHESMPLKVPNLMSQITARIPVKSLAINDSISKSNSTAPSDKVISSNFATVTIAQLRSRNSDHKSILHPISNLTHESLVSLKPAHKPSFTPIRPSFAPSLLNSSPINRPASKPEKFPESVDKNETSSINSSQETGPDRGSSSQSSTKTSASGSPELVGKGPQRLVRPSKKPPPVSTRGSLITDIWKFPPRRPAPVYPQPQVDSIATPCDPTVCQLPDCYCGKTAVPGNIPPQNVPQMVLLTFDDSVNDLNKKLYIDLFEKGRVNPNGCPIAATYYVSHEWTDYSQVQNLYSDGHEIASHSITHSFGEKFSTDKWAKEIGGQREIMSAYGGVRMEDIRGMRAPFLAIGGNNMFRMLYDLNFTYDSSMPVYENRPPSWPYTLDYKLFHDCMIPPCPTHSYPGVWQVPMVMWQDLTGGRCSMGDACTTPADAEGVYKFLIKNFERHYTTNRSPLGLYYHAAWFTTPHHKEGFIAFLDTITAMDDVWLVTSWQSLQWVRNPVPLSQAKSFKPFQCDYPERPPRCTTPKVCNVWHKGSVRYLKTCQQCPESYPWVGNTGVQSPLNDVV